jgi:16S rRNA (guanine(527)-N(7))-methyltransferase RsmG
VTTLFRDRLTSRLEAANRRSSGNLFPPLSAVQLTQLEQYFELLRRWNRRMNLTALPLETLEDATLDRMFVEPLAAAGFLRVGVCWADLGSGGGSPAIPLKVACPSTMLTMVESRGRKAAFLRTAASEVGLTDVAVENVRAEEMPARAVGSFAVVTVRAVRLDASFLAGITRLLAPRGRMVLFSPADAAFVFDGFELVQEVLIPGTDSRISAFSSST